MLGLDKAIQNGIRCRARELSGRNQAIARVVYFDHSGGQTVAAPAMAKPSRAWWAAFLIVNAMKRPSDGEGRHGDLQPFMDPTVGSDFGVCHDSGYMSHTAGSLSLPGFFPTRAVIEASRRKWQLRRNSLQRGRTSFPLWRWILVIFPGRIVAYMGGKRTMSSRIECAAKSDTSAVSPGMSSCRKTLRI